MPSFAYNGGSKIVEWPLQQHSLWASGRLLIFAVSIDNENKKGYNKATGSR